MGFTTIAFSEAVNSSTAVNIAGEPDQHVNVSGDNIRVPEFAPNLIGVYATGAGLTLPQLSSPSLRAKNLLDIEPYDAAAEPTYPLAASFFPERPIALTPSEDLQALGTDGAGSTTVMAFCWMADKIDAIPSGEIRTVRFTNATTLSVYAWTAGALTTTQQLEAGRYAIVGMRARSANLIAARLILVGSSFRPGVVGTDTAGDVGDPVFRNGRLGVYGEFDHVNLPQVEFYSGVADTSQVVHLDLIKIA